MGTRSSELRKKETEVRGWEEEREEEKEQTTIDNFYNLKEEVKE